MADYNVQMKQFNGTSFDNILPYASQALTLAGGGDATEIIAQARAGLSQIATGSYVGNGMATKDTTVSIVLPFAPKLVIIFPFTQVEWSPPDTSSDTYTESGFLQWLNNNESSRYFYYRVLQYAVWYYGLEKTPLCSTGSSYRASGAELIYSVNGTTLSWKVAQPSDARGFLDSVNAEWIYNHGQTYHYIAFG